LYVQALSQGESQATGKHAFDRRVDIYRNIYFRRPPVLQMPPVIIKGKVPPPQYRKIGFWVEGNYLDMALLHKKLTA